MSESSTKPYLIRAIHEWCSDNGYTPYLAVAVDERTQVPREHVKGGEIVLNVSPTATHRLTLGNDLITFQARFGGVARDLSIPVDNVSAIYARETGHGMAFDVPKAMAVAEPPASPDAPQPPAPGARGPLTLASVPADGPSPSGSGDAPPAADPSPDVPPDGTPPRGGRARLTRVK
ncbi:MAG TPA: ClpXP protease specificity-enhancing factor [Burkholderiaceae bacterium]|nr:ClpXP protease specificity-enhancing factor [Burkholderiaceae bacterium]